jgi:hypothetical protein
MAEAGPPHKRHKVEGGGGDAEREREGGGVAAAAAGGGGEGARGGDTRISLEVNHFPKTISAPAI